MKDRIEDQEMEVLRGLRARGFAVIVWVPSEIGEKDLDTLEELAISRGNEYLEYEDED